MFPKLSAAQIARIASHGVARRITDGEVLIESGETDVPFFVVKAGEIEVVRPSGPGDLVIAALRPGQFTGEVSMILGRPAMMRIRASESGEVVQLTRDQMHALIRTDADVSEVLMTALIHRRRALVARGIGDVLLIGAARSAATLRIRQFLTRNGHPFRYLDIDRDVDVRDLLDRFQVDRAEIPVMICPGGAVLKNESRYQACLPDDRGRGQHRVGAQPCHARHQRLHQDRTGPVAGRSGSRPMAARTLTVAPRNLTSWRVRRRRRSLRQYQARGVGGR
jgi:thioredoxin reductase (NADPH)